MPVNYANYPLDWKERRARILERAGNCCEKCGVRNHAVILRDPDGWLYVPDAQGDSVKELKYRGLTRIVLTIAHLDRAGAPGTPEGDGPLDCPDARLAALCQACHLRLDMPRHQAKRRAGRMAKLAAASLPLFEEVEAVR